MGKKTSPFEPVAADEQWKTWAAYKKLRLLFLFLSCRYFYVDIFLVPLFYISPLSIKFFLGVQ